MSTPPTERTTSPGPVTHGGRVAAGVLYLQVLAIVAVLVFYAVETVRGETNDVTRATMSMVTIALLGLFVALVARHLGRGALGARMPAIVWDVMLLPVGYGLLQGHQWGWGLLVLGAALAVIVGCALDLRARPGA